MSLVRRAHRERGSILVEFAIVAAGLVILLLGMFEIGGLWTTHQVVSQASRTGARVGSQLGTAAEADQGVLLAIEAALADQAADVTRIVIYEAGATGEMPSACETAAAGYVGSDRCNVYDHTHMAHLTSPGWWGSGTSCGTADANWCPATDRDDSQYTATYLGVYVEIKHHYLTSFFGGGGTTISDTTVMRLEPSQA